MLGFVGTRSVSSAAALSAEPERTGPEARRCGGGDADSHARVDRCAAASEERVPLAVIASGAVAVLGIVVAITWSMRSPHELPSTGLVVSPTETPSASLSIASPGPTLTQAPALQPTTSMPEKPVTNRTSYVGTTATTASSHPTVTASASAALTASAPPEQPTAVTVTGKAFDRDSAKAALKGATNAVGACRSPDHPEIVPSIPAQVRVTFGPSGAALTVEVEPPLTTTALGACVTKALRSVKVEPFDGAPVTVFKQFTFQ